MDWNALKCFLAVANAGSLSGAAQALGVNHSTIFRRLQSFEEEIGGRLFDRIDNRYHLTPLGEELQQRASDIAKSFDDVERLIAGKDFQPRGLVKITAPLNISCRFLPRYLADFRKQYPDIHIELLSSNLEFNMNSRQADIAVRATPSPPEHLVGRKITSIGWGVFASNAYIQKHGEPKSLDELAKHRLIAAAGTLRNLPGFIWLDQHHANAITTRCDDLTVMSCWAEVGEGLAFLPNDQERKGIRKILDFTPAKGSDLWILTHPDLRQVERIRLVMHCLVEAFKNFEG